MPEVVIYGRSPSIVVDDVATFVDIEHGLEFTVDDYLHSRYVPVRLQSASRCGDYPFLSNGKTTTVATVGIDRSRRRCILDQSHREQIVPLVLFLFTGGGKQVDVASNVAASLKVWLERFRQT